MYSVVRLLRLKIDNILYIEAVVLFKKGLLKNFTKSIGRQLCQSFFFNKFANSREKDYNFIKKRNPATGVFLWKTSIFKNIDFVKHVRTAAFVFKPTLTYPANISTSDQRCFNVEITLIWRWKWNKIRRRIFNVAQRGYNVSAQRWNNVQTTLHNVETTLHNVDTTLFQPSFDVTISNPVGLVILWVCKYMNSFYSSKWKNIFYYIY